MLQTVLRPAVILICCVALVPFHVESCLALCSHVVGFQSCLGKKKKKKKSMCVSGFSSETPRYGRSA